MKRWFCLVCLLLLQGEGRDFFSRPPPGSPSSGVCPVAPTPAGGVPPKRAPWQCSANLVVPPLPERNEIYQGVARDSPASRAPPFHTRKQSETYPPLRALAASTPLFTPCRGSGVATSHVSREPGAPGWAAPRGAGPWWPSQGSRGWHSGGASSPPLSRGVRSASPAALERVFRASALQSKSTSCA